MKAYDYNIGGTNDLIRVSTAKAKHYYSQNKTVYVKVAEDMWMSTNMQEDGAKDFENGTQFYVESDYDNDKIIVSRHQCVIDFFKSKGINARVVPCARLADVMGKTVYTTSCPLHLISFAKDAYILNVKDVGEFEFDNLTADELERHRHQVRHYVIDSKRVNEWSNVVDK